MVLATAAATTSTIFFFHFTFVFVIVGFFDAAVDGVFIDETIRIVEQDVIVFVSNDVLGRHETLAIRFMAVG